jgi:hypothetical protein
MKKSRSFSIAFARALRFKRASARELHRTPMVMVIRNTRGRILNFNCGKCFEQNLKKKQEQ